MLAVGVDIIEVERLTRGLARFGDRFCDRFFTPREQEQCAHRPASLALADRVLRLEAGRIAQEIPTAITDPDTGPKA